MRMPEKNENLVGKICVCSVGRPFIVTGREKLDLPNSAILEGWCGLGLDGKGTAFSTTPCIIAESGQEFHDKLKNRFDGKTSYND